MTITRRVPNSKRAIASFATIVVATVVAALSFPVAAYADPVTVYTNGSSDYPIQITQDAAFDWGTMAITATNDSSETTTIGMAADLTTQGVQEDLWLNPILGDETQAQLDPGDSTTQDMPYWPGTTIEFFSDIDTTPQLIGTYTMPGQHVRTAIGGTTDNPTLEIGSAVTWSPDPVIAGTGLAISATGVTPGTVEAYLDQSPSLDWAADGNLVQITGDPLWDLGSGTAAADGSLHMDGLVPPDTPPGQYTIEFENTAVFGVHFSAQAVDVVAGTPGQVVAGTVAISGAKKVGATLKATTATWDPIDATFEYQWFENGTQIPGATGAAFTLTTDQIGEAISVTATGFAAGDAPATASSLPTKTIPDTVDFTATTTPVIDGTAQVGDKLTADVAQWTPATGFSYQWDANGVPIGTDAKTYTLTPSELDENITVTVTSSKSGYAATSTTSTSVGPVAAGDITPPANASKPSIGGKQKVGGTVTVKLGNWTPDATFTYQWYIGQTAVPGASTASLVVPATIDGVSTIGSTLSVTLLASSPGYNPYSTTVIGTAIT